MKSISYLCHNLRQAIQAGETEAAGGLLHELLEGHKACGLAAVREKQLLLCGQDASQREALLKCYLSLVMEVFECDELTKEQATFVEYCRLVGQLRDEIAREANEIAGRMVGAGLAAGLEACCAAVWNIARQFARKNLGRHPNELLDPMAATTSRAAVSWELSGIFSLLEPMIAALGRASRVTTSYPREQTSLKELLRASRRLARVAEEWQAVQWFRDRIAFGFSSVDSVEEGRRVYTSPRSLNQARSELYARLRLGNRNLPLPPDQRSIGGFATLIEILTEVISHDMQARGFVLDEPDLKDMLQSTAESVGAPTF